MTGGAVGEPSRGGGGENAAAAAPFLRGAAGPPNCPRGTPGVLRCVPRGANPGPQTQLRPGCPTRNSSTLSQPLRPPI